jgi:hypothetical protein
MGQGNVGYGLDFRQLQYTQIGLPLVEPIEWIVDLNPNQIVFLETVGPNSKVAQLIAQAPH